MKCPDCKGSGIIKSTEHGLDSVYEVCDLCDGSGYANLTKGAENKRKGCGD